MQAVDALLHRHQQVGEGDAGAVRQRQAPDLEHHVLALVEHHQQVARVVGTFALAGEIPRVFVEVAVGLDVLHQEGRIEILDLAVAVHQARLEAERADAAGQGADRVQQALERDQARAAGRAVVRRRGIGDHVEQLHPVAVGHRTDPFEVVLAVQHLVERVR